MTLINFMVSTHLSLPVLHFQFGEIEVRCDHDYCRYWDAKHTLDVNDFVTV